MSSILLTKATTTSPTSILLSHCKHISFPSFGRSPSSSSLRVVPPYNKSKSHNNVWVARCSSSASTTPPPPPPSSDVISSSPVEEKGDTKREAADGLDLRVGHVIKAWKHPDADSLYVEEVDIGEPEPRTICSGLVQYVPHHELEGSNVIVFANLKPRNMRGMKSNGMLLAASDASHENVELIRPPEGSSVGERIWFGEDERGDQPDPATPNQVQKKKLWEAVQPQLKTTDECVVVLGDSPMRTATGRVVCKTLKNANVG